MSKDYYKDLSKIINRLEDRLGYDEEKLGLLYLNILSNTKSTKLVSKEGMSPSSQYGNHNTKLKRQFGKDVRVIMTLIGYGFADETRALQRLTPNPTIYNQDQALETIKENVGSFKGNSLEKTISNSDNYITAKDIGKALLSVAHDRKQNPSEKNKFERDYSLMLEKLSSYSN